MQTALKNNFLMLDFEAELSQWRVSSITHSNTTIRDVSLQCELYQNSGARVWPGNIEISRVDHGMGHDQFHGEYKSLSIEGRASDFLLDVSLEFRLLENAPLLIWQVALNNRATFDIFLERLSLFDTGPFASPRKIHPQNLKLNGSAPDSWYMNGWQSWSFAGTLKKGEKMLTGTRLGPATKPMYVNPSSSMPGSGDKFGSELYGIAGSQTTALGMLIGMLREQRAYGSIECRLSTTGTKLKLTADLEKFHLRPGDSFLSERAAIQFVDLADPEGELPYLQAVARENQVDLNKQSPVGWSSWYFFFENVTQEDVQRTSHWIQNNSKSIPLGLVQLDDGYQPQNGDWLEQNRRFSRGHVPLVESVEQAGCQAGLWLAPFIASPSAKIVAEHPEWLLRKNDRPVRAGYNWGEFFLALDVTHPEVLDYIERVIKTAVQEWGYRYLKLDFLYAASLAGKRWDQSQTGAEALRRALFHIREIAGPEVFLAACGCPLGPAIGLVDSMRVGPDVAPRWRPAFKGVEFFFEREPSLPSLRNSLQNTMARAPMNEVWWQNDPDCLLFREDKTRLSQSEIQLMASVAALSGNPLVFSDDLPRLSADRLAWVGRLIPPLEGSVHVLDRLRSTRCGQLLMKREGPVGSWVLLALVNWWDEQRNADFFVENAGLAKDRYIAIDFWGEEAFEFNGERWSVDIPAHGVRLFQIHPARDDTATWLGDTLHISGGQVVKAWQVRDNSLKAELDLGRRGSGRAWLKIPGALTAATLDGVPIEYKAALDGVVQLRFDRLAQGQLALEWH